MNYLRGTVSQSPSFASHNTTKDVREIVQRYHIHFKNVSWTPGGVAAVPRNEGKQLQKQLCEHSERKDAVKAGRFVRGGLRYPHGEPPGPCVLFC